MTVKIHVTRKEKLRVIKKCLRTGQPKLPLDRIKLEYARLEYTSNGFYSPVTLEICLCPNVIKYFMQENDTYKRNFTVYQKVAETLGHEALHIAIQKTTDARTSASYDNIVVKLRTDGYMC